MARVWLLLGDKLGDNAQAAVLAERLNIPTERRELRFKPQWVKGKPPFSASLYHIDQAASDALEPPWPDLVITIGRRPAMAALWVKQQSGGRTRLVLIGRPKRYFDAFDLVIGTGQYQLPDRKNVLKLTLPLMRSDETAVEAAVQTWRSRLESMPQPLTAVLVGGATKPFRFSALEAKDLVDRVRNATRDEGSLYFTTSRRTSRDVSHALQQALPPQARLFTWSPEAEEHDNPYLALLGLADRYVVTADSVSMAVETARRGRPLAIARLPIAGGALGRSLQRLQRNIVRAAARHPRFESAQQRLFDWGLLGYTRDFDSFHRSLRQSGWATFLEEGFRAPEHPVEDSADTAARAVRALLPANGLA